MSELLPEVLPLRHASREMIRELGFLQSGYTPAGVTHSECHAIIEVGDSKGMTQQDLAVRLRLDKSTTSRLVQTLANKGWVRAGSDAEDRRRALLELTSAGLHKLAEVHRSANAQVQSALKVLSADQRRQVLDGVALYARALGRARARAPYQVRPLRAADNVGLARVIREVMPEFGAGGAGFAIHDAEVDDMFASYRRPTGAYFAVVDANRVVGGGGVARLVGGDPKTCELRKMYFLPELRGLGFGQELIEQCLSTARELGFRRCYLETLKTMSTARALYEKNGFRRVTKPLGNTGHFSCDAWYVRPLEPAGQKTKKAAQGGPR